MEPTAMLPRVIMRNSFDMGRLVAQTLGAVNEQGRRRPRGKRVKGLPSINLNRLLISTVGTPVRLSYQGLGYLPY